MSEISLIKKRDAPTTAKSTKKKPKQESLMFVFNISHGTTYHDSARGGTFQTPPAGFVNSRPIRTDLPIKILIPDSFAKYRSSMLFKRLSKKPPTGLTITCSGDVVTIDGETSVKEKFMREVPDLYTTFNTDEWLTMECSHSYQVGDTEMFLQEKGNNCFCSASIGLFDDLTNMQNHICVDGLQGSGMVYGTLIKSEYAMFHPVSRINSRQVEYKVSMWEEEMGVSERELKLFRNTSEHAAKCEWRRINQKYLDFSANQLKLHRVSLMRIFRSAIEYDGIEGYFAPQIQQRWKKAVDKSILSTDIKTKAWEVISDTLESENKIHLSEEEVVLVCLRLNEFDKRLNEYTCCISGELPRWIPESDTDARRKLLKLSDIDGYEGQTTSWVSAELTQRWDDFRTTHDLKECVSGLDTYWILRPKAFKMIDEHDYSALEEYCKKSRRFDYTYEFGSACYRHYEEWANGDALCYAAKERSLKSVNIILSARGFSFEFPDKFCPMYWAVHWARFTEHKDTTILEALLKRHDCVSKRTFKIRNTKKNSVLIEMLLKSEFKEFEIVRKDEALAPRTLVPYNCP